MVRRWVPALVLGGVWWWAVLRLVLEPAHAGLVEGAVAAGGWGLSLLPVHVAATAGQAGRAGWMEMRARDGGPPWRCGVRGGGPLRECGVRVGGPGWGCGGWSGGSLSGCCV